MIMRMTHLLPFFFVIDSAFAAIHIEMTPKPDPPEAGENTLQIQLKDDSGKALEGAKIELLAFMPAMGTMPRMDEKSKIREKGGGSYEASFDLSMGGTWEVEVIVEKDSEKTKSHFSITTGVPGIAGKGGSGKDADGAGPSLELGPQRLQSIGVRFAPVQNAEMRSSIEAVGIVEQDLTHREELTLRYSGYVVKQFRGRIGDYVKAGEALFSIYSPDLVTAQSEFLLADRLSQDGHSLHAAASEKLKNLGLSAADIEQIRKSGQPRRDIVVRAPISGSILDIATREGASVNNGQVVYIIGDLSKSFIVARVFQQDIQSIRVGQAAMVSMPGGVAKPVEGRVDLIYPQLEQGAGTANIRIELTKALPGLKPGVYVDVSLAVNHGRMLTIPSEAVLYSGRHRYVFVDKGSGRLEPREVSLGRHVGADVQIWEGLTEGERVAASGTFLLGSEAQLRSALPKWSDTDGKETKSVPSNAPPAGSHDHGEDK